MENENDDKMGSLQRIAREEIRLVAEAANDPFQGWDIAFNVPEALRGVAGAAPANRNRGPGGSWPSAANASVAGAAPANESSSCRICCRFC